MQLRVIDTGYKNAFMNMAIDEALLTSKLPVLRFYRWKPAGLSLGYFQDINKIDVEQCKKLGIDVVRRLTGGDAVLHDKELTYSFIIGEESQKIVPGAWLYMLPKTIHAVEAEEALTLLVIKILSDQ